MTVWDAEGTGQIEFDRAEVRAPELGHIVENRAIVSLFEKPVTIVTGSAERTFFVAEQDAFNVLFYTRDEIGPIGQPLLFAAYLNSNCEFEREYRIVYSHRTGRARRRANF